MPHLSSALTLTSRPRYTAPDWALELVALAGLLAIYAILIAHWSALPERVPMKFSLAGQVTTTGPTHRDPAPISRDLAPFSRLA